MFVLKAEVIDLDLVSEELLGSKKRSPQGFSNCLILLGFLRLSMEGLRAILWMPKKVV